MTARVHVAAHQWCPVAQRWPRRPAAGWSQSAKRLLWPRATASADARMMTSSRLMSPSNRPVSNRS